MSKIIGNNIRKIRSEKRITLEELSKMCGVSSGAIGRYERGVTVPNVEIIQSIADVLEVSIEYLMKEHEYGGDKSKKSDEDLEDMVAGIGEAIKSIRESQGITSKKFAESVGLSRGALWKYETGYTGLSVISLLKIANELGIDMGELLGGVSEVSETQMEEIPVFEILKKKKVIDKPLFDIISSEVVELHKNGIVEDYIVTMSAEEFSVFIVSDSGSGAGLRGKFNGRYTDVGGFFDFLEELRDDIDE